MRTAIKVFLIIGISVVSLCVVGGAVMMGFGIAFVGNENENVAILGKIYAYCGLATLIVGVVGLIVGKKIKEETQFGVPSLGLIIATLIFVSLPAGIMLLCVRSKDLSSWQNSKQQDDAKEDEPAPEQDPNVLLRVENLCQYFKLGPGMENKAVDNVSFDVKKGEVFGLVGESGCGKTTTGRSIIRLYDITSGSVYFKGQRICAGIRAYKEKVRNAKIELAAKTKELKRIGDEAAKAEIARLEEEFGALLREQTANIRSARFDHQNCNKLYALQQINKIEAEYAPLLAAETDEEKLAQLLAEKKEKIRLAKKDRIMNGMQMIFQDPIASLNPRMTVREIIAEGLIIRGIKDKKYIDEQVYRVLNLVGLVEEHAGRYPHEFSGGQRQRIGIARAIVLNPDLIIADEPISALDVSIQAQVINLLNGLREQLGLTILFIAHDLSVVKYFSDRIGVMYYGKMVELASADELFAHPLHPYTKSLLSAIPLPDPDYEKGRQRIVYNPLAEHDYSVDKPTMREIAPEHYILCNDAEFEKYKQQISCIKVD